MSDHDLLKPYTQEDSFRAGIYRHYKGQFYEALHLASDSNGDELVQFRDRYDFNAGWEDMDGRIVVVYVGLELDGAQAGPRHHTRTLSDFFAYVHPAGSPHPEGTVCPPEHVIWRGNRFVASTHSMEQRIPRFTWMGPVWNPSWKDD